LFGDHFFLRTASGEKEREIARKKHNTTKIKIERPKTENRRDIEAKQTRIAQNEVRPDERQQ